MSDDEADPELLELLRQHLRGNVSQSVEPETQVLEGHLLGEDGVGG